MKILVVLLSILVLGLNAIPCCADDCSSEDIAQQQENNAHSNELCSPFLNCGTCNAVVLQEELSKMLFSEPVISEAYSKAEDHLISTYSFRIWQPPRK